MRNLLLAVFVLACSFSAIAQNKHPFTFEDMMALKRVEEPVPSPDGKWVLFAAVDVDLKANTKTPHVWAVPLNTHVSQQQGEVGHPISDRFNSGVPHFSPVLREVGFTAQTEADSSTPVGMTKSREREIISDQDADRPRWAPDGKRFAFVSTKEGGSQIWIADFDGASGTVTAKRRFTNIATEADGELWSPDGRYILFVSSVYPKCDGSAVEEENCNKEKLQQSKDSKISAQVFTHLLYRHWNEYKKGKRSHLFAAQAPQSELGGGSSP